MNCNSRDDMEFMENNNHQTKSQSRRNFVKKALAGSMVVSLPTKSVWAQTSITASAGASGNGSDANSIVQYNLESPDYWRYNMPYEFKYKTFKDIFGVSAYKAKYHDSFSYYHTEKYDTYLYKILGLHRSSYAGYADYNRLCISMFLNAAMSGQDDIYYPVVEDGTFSSSYAFARKLIELTYSNPETSAHQLTSIIENPSSFNLL